MGVGAFLGPHEPSVDKSDGKCIFFIKNIYNKLFLLFNADRLPSSVGLPGCGVGVFELITV